MEKQIEKSRTNGTAVKTDQQIAEIVGQYKGARDEILRLPKLMRVFKANRMYLDLGYDTFSKWKQYRFRGSNLRPGQLVKIGKYLVDVARFRLRSRKRAIDTF